jgi:hypothetical protein
MFGNLKKGTGRTCAQRKMADFRLRATAAERQAAAFRR